jgi:SAM-dependent methyltransferase
MHAAVRRVFYGLRTEGAGRAREAAAIGVGVFIGCLPFYGLHLLLCWLTGWFLGLNRLKIYVAANISNPLFAPTLIFTELQMGAWFRRGAFHPLTRHTARTANLSVFGFDILIGSLVLGVTLGAILAALTYASSRGNAGDGKFLDLVRTASDRYVTTSIAAWEFARGKLRGDPIYRATVCDGLLPSGGTLIDIGCGGGLALALLADARSRFRAGDWPAGSPPPPQFERMIGIEMRQRAAAIATEALGSDAEIVADDVRRIPLAPCDAVLLFDVLHMIPADEQEPLIAAIAAALRPGGVALVREADAAAGWRFVAVRFGNRLKALAFGRWRQRFWFRRPEEWLARFAAHGLAGEALPMSTGTPFANVLFQITAQAPAPASATSRRPSPVA